MSEIHKTVTVDAAVERIVDFLDNPRNIALFVPNVARVVDVNRPGQRVGTTFRVIYRRLGMKFDIEILVSRFEGPRRTTPHRRYQLWWSFQGLIRGSSVWTLEALDNQTEAGIDLEYQLMGGVVGRAVDWLVVERTNQKSVTQMLANMKRVLEIPAG